MRSAFGGSALPEYGARMSRLLQPEVTVHRALWPARTLEERMRTRGEQAPKP